MANDRLAASGLPCTRDDFIPVKLPPARVGSWPKLVFLN